MKIIFALLASILCTLASADESVELKAALNIYKCSISSCITPILNEEPIKIELAPANPTSAVLVGSLDLEKVFDSVSYTATIQIVKIPTGPTQGYLVQIFILAVKDGIAVIEESLGSVLVDNLSQLNRASWKSSFTYGDQKNTAVISIGPKTNPNLIL